MKKFKLWTVVLTLIIGIVVGVVAQELRFASSVGIANLESLLNAISIAKNNSVTDVDTQTMVNGMLKGLALSLEDDYARYYSPEELAQNNDNKNGIIRGGVGITTALTQDGIAVSEIYPDSPAEKAGMKVEDIIIEIDGVSGDALVFDNLDELVNGEIGTTVSIRVRRGENELLFNLERAVVNAPMIKYRQIGNITYIQYKSFYGNAPELFKRALQSAKDNASTGIIIDLRDNLGGNVEVLASTADMILPQGSIIYAIDKNGNRVEDRKSDANKIDLPIVILVNGYSASASEAFVGAARDHKVAITVGTKTYGKGIIQTTYTLANQGAIKLTTAKYYLPNGECIHGVGITPDYVVELPDGRMSPDGLTDQEDTQLQKALELLG